ncbi:MAG: cobalamin-dependent protein [Deltaproteobacteria bacterium]|nr:cobalamin-dependent protein [Deltaproteobacteria bacterium]MBW1984641.1 cobalamin-dependent protein [Deltaproteobacteria bacterium]MBW2363999.1 cobalamin-dependent protein [Deltaproteobacteria bacterium]
MKEAMMAIRKAVVDINFDTCLEKVKECLENGASAVEIIEEGLSPGMTMVGELFEKGEYFLGELVMAGDLMDEAMESLEGKFEVTERGKKGKVILATVEGDIHEIGKNIVGMMLSASGFEVIDLGIDVKAEKIVESVKKTNAKGLGLTMLLTTAIGSANEVVEALKEAGLRDKIKIAIGGACTNDQLAKDLGMDAYGSNAVQAVRIFDNLLGVS